MLSFSDPWLIAANHIRCPRLAFILPVLVEKGSRQGFYSCPIRHAGQLVFTLVATKCGVAAPHIESFKYCVFRTCIQ